MNLQEGYTPTRDNLNDLLSTEERALIASGDYVDHNGVAVIPTSGLSVQSVEDAVRYQIEREQNLGD